MQCRGIREWVGTLGGIIYLCQANHIYNGIKYHIHTTFLYRHIYTGTYKHLCTHTIFSWTGMTKWYGVER
jgi:hypothetical protein